MQFENKEIWLVAGSQHLYGEEALKEVQKNAKKIAEYYSELEDIFLKVKFKGVLTRSSEIKKLIFKANSSTDCVGLICWMHTFSPAKMWITGLKFLQKPMLHLHTQFRREIPWNDIDMDYMNINQSAHGGREFGFINSRMKIKRKVVAGYWQDKDVINEIDTWVRAALAWNDAQEVKIARFGDNMRRVAVTEGDKVEAEMQFGYSVEGYGLKELGKYIQAVPKEAISAQLDKYQEEYSFNRELIDNKKNMKRLEEAARIELGMREFLSAGDFAGFTTTFENLAGLKQLPGLAVQRLMKDGYGFGAEGDWKTAALVRAVKVMGTELAGGTSFMEQYTYHLKADNYKVLGAHMLEVCETIAADTPGLEIHPLDIGGKDDPVRAIFNVPAGSAINCSVMDMGDRFRMLANQVEVVEPEEDLPNLPVARVLWEPKPDFSTAVKAWIYGGGAHHTCFSQAVTLEHIEDFALLADIEFISITEEKNLQDIKNELKWNEAYYKIR